MQGNVCKPGDLNAYLSGNFSNKLSLATASNKQQQNSNKQKRRCNRQQQPVFHSTNQQKAGIGQIKASDNVQKSV